MNRMIFEAFLYQSNGLKFYLNSESNSEFYLTMIISVTVFYGIRSSFFICGKQQNCRYHVSVFNPFSQVSTEVSSNNLNLSRVTMMSLCKSSYYISLNI